MSPCKLRLKSFIFACRCQRVRSFFCYPNLRRLTTTLRVYQWEDISFFFIRVFYRSNLLNCYFLTLFLIFFKKNLSFITVSILKGFTFGTETCSKLSFKIGLDSILNSWIFTFSTCSFYSMIFSWIICLFLPNYFLNFNFRFFIS